MFIVAKTKKIDTLKISKILLTSFFGVLQCTLLGAALDKGTVSESGTGPLDYGATGPVPDP